MMSLAAPDDIGSPIVLVVAPVPDRASSLVRMLRAHGFAPRSSLVGAAPSTLRGVEAVLIEPGGSESAGWEALRAIRRRAPHLPVLMIAGASQPGAEAGGMAGADDLLVRGIGAEDLVMQLRTKIRRARSRQRAGGGGFREREKLSEEYFRSMLEGALDFSAVLDRNGVLEYASPSVHRVLEADPGSLVGRRITSLIHPDDFAPVERLLARMRAAPGSSFTARCRLRDGSGEWRFVEYTVRDLLNDPAVGGLVINARDVTERRIVEEALRDAAFRDDLTGLPNRALFVDRLEQAIARGRRNPDPSFALLFLDLDRFKVVNDRLGHAAGDRLLMGVAERLRGHLRPQDTLARFGGDEFAILLEALEETSESTRIAGRIADVLAAPLHVDGVEMNASASIGIVLGSGRSESPEALLRNADMAMYQAKATGGGTFALYDHAMHAAALRRLELEAQMRRALERDELRLYVQPIVRVEDGSTLGVETLLRWDHPEEGLIGPVGFIDLAEETGCITAIGSWVLERAVEHALAWQDALGNPGFFVSVNLSEKQLDDPGLIGHVRALLKRTGIRPNSLRLEVTERTLAGGDRTVRTLRDLGRLGVQIHLDDFGTGLASLSHLQRLPLSGIKIDGTFVRRMATDPHAGVLVECALMMAKRLRLEVVAEGVEEESQRAELGRLGCELAQGYLFSIPVPASRLVSRMERDRGR